MLIFKPFALLLALSAGLAQEAAAPVAPPMKMGLWEITSTVTMSGAAIAKAPAPRATKARVCITPDTWTKSMQTGPASACTRSHESASSSHYSADLACPTLMATGHVDLNFASADAGHGTIHLDADIGGTKFAADTVLDMHFVSAGCGSVTPDHPVVVP